MTNNLTTGNKGEDLACQFLKEQGYKILERNYRIRGGEIDIVAKDKDYLVFVEVKARYSHKFGLPIEAITPWKLKALLKSALFYIQKIKWGDKGYRIDLISIDYTEGDDNPRIDLIKNITL
ncbi:YraN family protein [Candidatus Daviesbacteria bacterium]|nr:YraN family protein [Candidatus Daviesbacteria bacterium]